MDALKHYTINVFWILYWLAMSSKVAAESYQQVDVNIDGEVARNVNVEIPNACQSALLNLSLEKESESPFEGIDFAIHRNGEPQPCGVVTTDIASMLRALTPFENKCHELTKYDVESFLTQLFADQLWSKKCKSKEKKSKKSTALKGMYGYCDRGPDRTAELMDYEDLVRVPSGSLPCRFFTREGVRVKSLQELAELAQKQKKAMSCTEGNNTCDSALVAELHLYAVPASKVFMFAPSFVGEIFDLPHVQVDNGLPVSMEVLSVNPRVFDLKNFFSKEEAMELIQEALNEKQQELQMKRSYTGFSEDHIISTRTSETGWPTWSDLVIKILKRAFSTVGYDDFWLSHTDGIQVLRYNESKAYAPHVDYLHDPDGNQLFDYDSAKKGGNRFATILLYMNELGDQDGGETVFSEAWPQAFSEDAKITIQQATEALRASGDASMLDKGSWEEEMVATCRTRLSVRPTLGRAVLFYSQHPNGKVDEMSRHGGCPVLNGVKWAANVWLWSTPREGFTRAPLKKSLPQTSQQLYATFSNSGNDPVFENAVLYFEDNFWGKLGYGDPPLSVNTYPGHRWNVKVDQETLKTFIIGNDDRQEYVV